MCTRSTCNLISYKLCGVDLQHSLHGILLTAIGAVVGTDAILVMELAIFGIMWISFAALFIVVGPKAVVLFQTAANGCM